jgi:hypothetical protein
MMTPRVVMMTPRVVMTGPRHRTILHQGETTGTDAGAEVAEALRLLPTPTQQESSEAIRATPLRFRFASRCSPAQLTAPGVALLPLLTVKLTFAQLP